MVYSKDKKQTKLSFANLRKQKSLGRKFSMVTCYDFSFAKIVESSEVDMILVGDSLANVMMGESSTLAATVDHIVHHCKAVSKGLKTKLLIADMPFLACGVSREKTIENAGRLMSEGNAHGVKIEGAGDRVDDIKALVDLGIPVVGHLGLMPQKVHAHGGYRVQGRSEDAAKQISKDALSLQDAGVSILVVEMLQSDIAKHITDSLDIPVIGIGAGKGCDGQVLVLQDLLGMNAEFEPTFLRKYMQLADSIKSALNKYDSDVKSGEFPNESESFARKTSK